MITAARLRSLFAAVIAIALFAFPPRAATMRGNPAPRTQNADPVWRKHLELRVLLTGDREHQQALDCVPYALD